MVSVIVPHCKHDRKSIVVWPYTLNELPIRRGFVVVVVLLFYVHGKHLRLCRDGELTFHTFPGQA